MLYESKTKTELCEMFGGISLKTLASWLKPFQSEIGAYRGKAYTPKQVKIIIEKLT